MLRVLGKMIKFSTFKLAGLVVSFLVGYLWGNLSRSDSFTSCIHKLTKFREEIAVEPCPIGALPVSTGCPRQLVTSTATHVHSHYFRTISKSALSTVFGMLHHPSCPSEGELILTSSDQWSDDYSVCTEVYAVRAATRTDHPNKCIAVMRTDGEGLDGPHYSLTGINHRYGSIEYPSKISDAYQVSYHH